MSDLLYHGTNQAYLDACMNHSTVPFYGGIAGVWLEERISEAIENFAK
ncbi:MAG TPA: hypothetical protein VJA18_05505 [Candidatus Nanoarchaeia archaeon]|nr:hypothetical protein [Candidatus Nanoarchaeia archaeon]